MKESQWNKTRRSWTFKIVRLLNYIFLFSACVHVLLALRCNAVVVAKISELLWSHVCYLFLGHTYIKLLQLDDELWPEDHRTTGGDGSWLQRWIHDVVCATYGFLVPRTGVDLGDGNGTAHLDGAPQQPVLAHGLAATASSRQWRCA
jgi:hypothetical protein